MNHVVAVLALVATIYSSSSFSQSQAEVKAWLPAFQAKFEVVDAIAGNLLEMSHSETIDRIESRILNDSFLHLRYVYALSTGLGYVAHISLR